MDLNLQQIPGSRHEVIDHTAECDTFPEAPFSFNV